MISDITPGERMLLSRIRFRPVLYLGKPSLRDFDHMSSGYQYAMQTVGMGEAHNLLPEGLSEFTNRWYGGNMGTCRWSSVIALHEPDDSKALATFFEILDAYLAELGYDPIPEWDSSQRL